MEDKIKVTQYQKKREILLEKSKAYYWLNKDKVNAYFKDYYQKNKERILEKNRNRILSCNRKVRKYRKKSEKFLDFRDVEVQSEKDGMTFD